MTILLDRRSVLAGAAAALAAGPARADDTDVVVIGAGAAGIAAARELRRLGKRFVVVEASNRVGGRLYTDRSLNEPFDAGAAYIHFADRNPWSEIATELGIDPLGGYRLWAGSLAYRNGVPLSPDESSSRWTALRSIGDFYDEVDERQDLSMAQALRGAPQEVQDAARIQAQMAAGEDPERVSVSDWQRLESGSNRLPPGGYGTLAERAAEGLPIRTGVAVSAISHDRNGVVVRTNQGDIRARKVIVTVSIGVLKSGAIRFTPSLPLSHSRALDGLVMGALSKVALRFEKERFGFVPHQFLAEIGDPRTAVTFETWPHDRNIVLAVFGGDHARGIVRQGEQPAVDLLLERFVKIVGSDARKHFTGGRLAGWPDDPYSRGSYAVALPGQMRARETLARPIADRLWLAGEATADVYSMTAGGASIAGREAARQVASRLGTGFLR
jgi:monoamine oxidase